MDKRSLTAILQDIDEEICLTYGIPSERSCVVIVGGSALMLQDLTKRPTTHDMDILVADSHVRTVMQHYPTVNGSVSAYADTIPYNFEDRLTEIKVPTKAIRFTTPSLEDIAVMKLYAWRPNDIEDITSPAFLERLNWEQLEYLVYNDNEAKASALSERRYNEMVHIFEMYKEQYRR